jgi:hypothetical protein
MGLCPFQEGTFAEPERSPPPAQLEFTVACEAEFVICDYTIEAGIKETNVVFKAHPLKLRSRGGIALQEQFTLFAANFVHWAAVWLKEQVSCSTRRFDDALTRVKSMVRVAANTSAWVVADREGLLVRFDDTGAYPGVELRLAGTWRTRAPLLPPQKVQDFDFRDELVVGCT